MRLSFTGIAFRPQVLLTLFLKYVVFEDASDFRAIWISPFLRYFTF